MEITRMFSRACEYGIRAVVYIARQSNDNKRTSLKQVAAKVDSPEAFTAKILQQLVRHNIIDSVKGASGGFEIQAERMDSVKLIDIVLAIDNGVFDGCVLGLQSCSEKKPCPVHHKYKSIKLEIKTMLHQTTLLEMTQGVNNKLTYLKY